MGAQALKRAVRVAHAPRGSVFLGIQRASGGAALKIRKLFYFIDEESVDPCFFVYDSDRLSFKQSREHAEQAAVVADRKIVGGRIDIFFRIAEGIRAAFRAADGFHQRFLEALTDRHDLAGRFHLRAERALCRAEFIERPFREFDDDVIECGLEAGAGLARDVVLYLVERVAERDLRRYLCDLVSGRLGGERGGTRHARIHLDHRVFEGIRVERELAVAAADDAELRYDIERRGAKHLKFLIRKSEARRDNDGIARVYSDGIDVLHRADRDRVPGAVAQCLEFDLLPAEDVFFDEDLRDRGHVQPELRAFAHFAGAAGDAASGSAERERGADYHGVSDLLRCGERAVNVGCDFGGDGRLTELSHRVAEHFAVLGAVDRSGIGTEEAHSRAVEESA